MPKVNPTLLSRIARWIACLTCAALLFGNSAGAKLAQGASLNQAEDNAFLYLPLVLKDFQWRGAWIGGKVLDARDQNGDGQPDPIAEAEVCTQYGECALSDSQGEYQISLGDTARREVTASKTGFIALTQAVNPLANQTVSLNFILSQPLEDVVSRMVLTWKTTPTFPAEVPEGFVENDLDAYLFMEHQTGKLTVYYAAKGNCTEFPSACLLYDVRRGSGPETIDLAAIEGGDPPTVYHFAVHHANYLYSGRTMPTLAELEARVCLYFRGQERADCYSAPPGEHQLWYVLTMDEGKTVTLKNCLSDDPPDTEGANPPQCP